HRKALGFGSAAVFHQGPGIGRQIGGHYQGALGEDFDGSFADAQDDVSVLLDAQSDGGCHCCSLVGQHGMCWPWLRCVDTLAGGHRSCKPQRFSLGPLKTRASLVSSIHSTTVRMSGLASNTRSAMVFRRSSEEPNSSRYSSRSS